MGRRRLDVLERISDKVLIGDDCWEWIATKAPNGYGRLRIDGKDTSAHRMMYELMVGPIPAGLQLDHLCSNRACVRPDHLEPVTARENLRRSKATLASRFGNATHCIHGHPFDEENTKINPQGAGRGWRLCKTCEREKWRRGNERRSQAKKTNRKAM